VSLYTGIDLLPAIREAALAIPDLPIVLDHFALPDLAQTRWKEILELADSPRTYVKVSGYHHFSAQGYPYEDAWELFRAVHDAFGPDRLLWGSDFPHVLLRSGYGRSRLLQERAFGFLDADELAAIMGGTATKLYWTATGA
jgi:L-fuconolactonase